MASEPDVDHLHEQIDQTRADLTDKLETLENQVMDSVQSALGTVSSARENVQDTIDQVSSAVHDTVEQVTSSVQDTVDQVKQAFDVDYQVRARPWVLVGGSVVAGALVGALVGRQTRGTRHRAFTGYQAPYPPAEGRAAPEMETATSFRAPRSAPARPGLFSSLFRQFEPELEKVKGMAIGYAAGAVRDLIKQSAPSFGEQIDEMMNDITSKLGGKPVPGPVLSPSGETCGRHDGGAAEGRFGSH